jgi:hypothetical protein
MESKNNQDIFANLVKYHYLVNLPKCIPHIKNGQICDLDGIPLIEGDAKGESPYYGGCIIIADGDRLAKKLLDDNYIFDEPDEFVPVTNNKDFFVYLYDTIGSDGAYISNGDNKTMSKIIEFNNSIGNLTNYQTLLEKSIPHDFIYESGVINVKKLGTKTRLAIKIPKSLGYNNVHTYQIKRSSFGYLRMGKVTHFGKDGLMEEFYFKYAPYEDVPYVRDDHPIAGIYKSYESNDKGLQLINAEPIYFKTHSRFKLEDLVEKPELSLTK